MTQISRSNDAVSLSANARKSCERKKQLKDLLPVVAVMTVGFVVMWGAWRAFTVEDLRESVVQFRNKGIIVTELRSLSHEEGSEGLRTQVKGNNGAGGRSAVSEILQDEDSFAVQQHNSSTEDVTGLVNTGFPPYYRLGKPITDWDRQRELWFEKHPAIKNQTVDGRPRLFMLTGSQPERCKTSTGDNLMLRSFKNKVDYCRLHEVGIFYNVAILDKKMDSFWSKLPLVRAAMEAHPEAEWLWWVDSDLLITDMEFKIPLERYDAYNLIVPGWESEIFERRNAMGLNAGSFLVRNCGWTVKFLDRWASMGPKGRIRDEAGKLQSAFLWNREPTYPSDDQSALIYFMVKERAVWGEKILLETSYNLNGYWLDLVGGMEAVEAAEREEEGGGGEAAAVMGEKEVLEVAAGRRRAGAEGRRRSFVTHFAGCQPCSGNSNPTFGEGQCLLQMERALKLADNQVLRGFGFRHPSLDTNEVERLP